MLEYRVIARRVDAHRSVALCKDAEVVLDTDVAGRLDAFNPAELFLAAIAACMIKGIERVTPMLKFDLRGVEVTLHGVRQDSPPKMVSVDYELIVDTAEDDRRLELLHTEQLLVTPFRPFEILVGKSSPAMIIGLAEGTVIVAVGVFWFGVPLRGDLVLLYAGMFLYILSVIGVGLMISAVSRTQQQAILGAFLFVVPAVILLGLRDADRQHAVDHPGLHARQPDALLPDHRPRNVPRRPAGELDLQPVVADGGNRGRHARRRELDVPPPTELGPFPLTRNRTGPHLHPATQRQYPGVGGRTGEPAGPVRSKTALAGTADRLPGRPRPITPASFPRLSCRSRRAAFSATTCRGS